MKVILGDITFFDPQVGDKEYKAIVHKVVEEIECETVEEACIAGEEGLNRAEGYLIPELYKYPITYVS